MAQPRLTSVRDEPAGGEVGVLGAHHLVAPVEGEHDLKFNLQSQLVINFKKILVFESRKEADTINKKKHLNCNRYVHISSKL